MVSNRIDGMALETKRPRPTGFARCMHTGLIAGLIPVCLAVFGCAGGPPTVLLDTPTGVVPLNSPSPSMPGGLVAPPPGMETVPPGVPQSVSRDGSYTGTAEPLVTGGGLCLNVQPVGGFIVRGNSARYGGFRGRIAADGGLQMVYGQDWIVGQFEGATFHGQLDLRGRFGAPGCTYMLSLERSGS
jgi:hypothetical protein